MRHSLQRFIAYGEDIIRFKFAEMRAAAQQQPSVPNPAASAAQRGTP